MTMSTTTREIFKIYKPGCFGWIKLLTKLGKTKPDDEPVSLEYILDSNGIRDAVWALQLFEYVDYCWFLADIAESVLPLFEKEHKNDDSIRKLIQLIRNYHAGEVLEAELEIAAKKVENNIPNDFIAGSVCCVAIFAAGAHLGGTFPSSAINAAMDIDASLQWRVIEPSFRRYFSNQE